jgi:hypothetical protein
MSHPHPPAHPHTDTVTEEYVRVSDSLVALLRAAWLVDPWSPPQKSEEDGDEEEEEEDNDDDYLFVKPLWLPHARAMPLVDPPTPDSAVGGRGRRLLLRASWRALSSLLYVFGPALQSEVCVQALACTCVCVGGGGIDRLGGIGRGPPHSLMLPLCRFLMLYTQHSGGRPFFIDVHTDLLAPLFAFAHHG